MCAIPHMTDVFERLVDIELSLGALYARYAQRFPDYADAWASLARDERRHAEWLRTLQLEVQEGEIAFDAARFHDDALAAFEAKIGQAQTEADAVDINEAVATALVLESSIIERRFFEVVADTKPIVGRVYETLRTETELHQAKLVAMHTALGE